MVVRETLVFSEHLSPVSIRKKRRTEERPEGLSLFVGNMYVFREKHVRLFIKKRTCFFRFQGRSKRV